MIAADLLGAFGGRPSARSANTWSATARGDLARTLRANGTTIQELSDARELLGFPRLSDASAWDRANAHLNVESPELVVALVEVRRQRAGLLAGLRAVDWKARRAAHRMLDLQGERDLRLPELVALHRQAILCDLAADGAPIEALVEAEYLVGAPALVEYGHGLTPAEVADAEACFARAEAL